MTSSKRCVVTGAAGFIGSHVVDRLLADGHTVVGVDCFTDYYPRHIKERNLEGARSRAGFSFVEADLRTADLAPILDGVDVVVHEAAMGGLLRSWTEFETYVSCNIMATHRLLEAILQSDVGLLVHASTSSVYGRASSGDETLAQRPVSPYGITKLAAENLVRAYARNFGVPMTVLRYYSIYGPRQRPDMGYYIFIDSILRGNKITIAGDGTQTRGNTFVRDCVDATVRAVDFGPTGDIFNIGGGEVISAIDAVHMIEDIAGIKAHVTHGPPRPGEQTHALADTSKARETFEWQPTTGIREGLEAQVEWQRSMLIAEASV